MIDEDILDVSVQDNSGPPGYKYAVNWWESRRIHYNIRVAIAGVTVFILMFFVDAQVLSNNGMEMFLYFSLFFFILYNVCYTLSWVIEFIMKYYFRYHFKDITRKTFFNLGLIISCLPFFLLLFLLFVMRNI
jgi:hypothetical protein